MLRTSFQLLSRSATAALLVACSNGGLVSIAPPPPGPPPPPGSGAPAAITEVSGGDQTGLAGAVLEQPLVVRVTDNAGGGVANAAVRWEAGSGQLTICFPTESECHTPPVFVNTDAQGLSSTWVPGGRFTFVPSVAGVWSYQEQLSGATAQITAQ